MAVDPRLAHNRTGRHLTPMIALLNGVRVCEATPAKVGIYLAFYFNAQRRPPIGSAERNQELEAYIAAECQIVYRVI